MRTALTHASMFGLVVVWDWLTTVYTRLAAADNLWAVLVGVGLTAFWWVAVRLCVKDNWLVLPALAGAGVGTYLGIIWP